MGEPPSLLGDEVDKNPRYRRLHYEQATEPELQDYPLGYAAAASAGMPGLLAPLVIDKLYPEHDIRLADGGIHDNQGTQGLLNEGCTLIFCSDASSHIRSQERPSGDPLAVLTRAGSILKDRVREAEYQDLRERLDSRTLEGLFFVHLQKGLSTAYHRPERLCSNHSAADTLGHGF